MEALRAGGNTNVRVDGSGAVFYVGGEREEAVGRTTEGLKLDFALSCGTHKRRCTPNALREPRRLLCRFCTPANELKKNKCERPSSIERAAFDVILGLANGGEWRWQVCPPAGPHFPTRPKPLDFLHAPTGVYFKVDGQQHFKGGMHGVPSTRQQQIDIESMVAVWREGGALVRLHHADLAGAAKAARATAEAALQYRKANPLGPLLILTPSYNPGPVIGTTRFEDPWYFINRLPTIFGSAPAVINSNGSMWLLPPPLTS